MAKTNAIHANILSHRVYTAPALAPYSLKSTFGETDFSTLVTPVNVSDNKDNVNLQKNEIEEKVIKVFFYLLYQLRYRNFKKYFFYLTHRRKGTKKMFKIFSIILFILLVT